jgi:hypothetical protein
VFALDRASAIYFFPITRLVDSLGLDLAIEAGTLGDAILMTFERGQFTAMTVINFLIRSAPACGAKTRAGHPCRQAAVRGRARCRMHGGAKGSGGPRATVTAISSTGSIRARPKRTAERCEQKIREIEAVVRAADQPRHSSHRRSGRSAPTLNTENHAERGRPSDYSTDIAMRICERLVAGERYHMRRCWDAGQSHGIRLANSQSGISPPIRSRARSRRRNP